MARAIPMSMKSFAPLFPKLILNFSQSISEESFAIRREILIALRHLILTPDVRSHIALKVSEFIEPSCRLFTISVEENSLSRSGRSLLPMIVTTFADFIVQFRTELPFSAFHDIIIPTFTGFLENEIYLCHQHGNSMAPLSRQRINSVPLGIKAISARLLCSIVEHFVLGLPLTTHPQITAASRKEIYWRVFCAFCRGIRTFSDSKGATFTTAFTNNATNQTFSDESNTFENSRTFFKAILTGLKVVFFAFRSLQSTPSPISSAVFSVRGILHTEAIWFVRLFGDLVSALKILLHDTKNLDATKSISSIGKPFSLSTSSIATSITPTISASFQISFSPEMVAFFANGLGYDTYILQNQLNGEEKELVEQVAQLFILLDVPIFSDALASNCGHIYKAIEEIPSLCGLLQVFLLGPGGFEVAKISLSHLLRWLCRNIFSDLINIDTRSSAVLQRVLRLCLLALGGYPDELESIWAPFLSEIILACLKSGSLLRHTLEPVHSFLVLKTIFKAIGGGRFETLYKEIIPILPTILENLNNLLGTLELLDEQKQRGSSPLSHSNIQSTEYHSKCQPIDALKELVVELALTIPVRLSVLLPYLSLLMKPLVCSLKSSAFNFNYHQQLSLITSNQRSGEFFGFGANMTGMATPQPPSIPGSVTGPSIPPSSSSDLLSQGLRTLELCIDNLTQDFLDPILSNVMPELLEALWTHCKPLPYPSQFAHTSLRILGKMAGRNRRQMRLPRYQTAPSLTGSCVNKSQSTASETRSSSMPNMTLYPDSIASLPQTTGSLPAILKSSFIGRLIELWDMFLFCPSSQIILNAEEMIKPGVSCTISAYLPRITFLSLKKHTLTSIDEFNLQMRFFSYYFYFSYRNNSDIEDHCYQIPFIASIKTTLQMKIYDAIIRKSGSQIMTKTTNPITTQDIMIIHSDDGLIINPESDIEDSNHDPSKMMEGSSNAERCPDETYHGSLPKPGLGDTSFNLLSILFDDFLCSEHPQLRAASSFLLIEAIYIIQNPMVISFIVFQISLLVLERSIWARISACDLFRAIFSMASVGLSCNTSGSSLPCTSDKKASSFTKNSPMELLTNKDLAFCLESLFKALGMSHQASIGITSMQVPAERALEALWTFFLSHRAKALNQVEELSFVLVQELTSPYELNRSLAGSFLERLAEAIYNSEESLLQKNVANQQDQPIINNQEQKVEILLPLNITLPPTGAHEAHIPSAGFGEKMPSPGPAATASPSGMIPTPQGRVLCSLLQPFRSTLIEKDWLEKRSLSGIPLSHQIGIIEGISFILRKDASFLHLSMSLLSLVTECVTLADMDDPPSVGAISTTFSGGAGNSSGIGVGSPSSSSITNISAVGGGSVAGSSLPTTGIPGGGPQQTSVLLATTLGGVLKSGGGSPLVIRLRVACIRLLTGIMGCFEFLSTTSHLPLRNRIVSIFFKSLYARNAEIVGASKTGLALVISMQHKLPKELMQHGLRPVLMNLSDYKRLTVPGLEGLGRLLELLTCYFKAEIGRKLLEHLKQWADAAALSATPEMAATEIGIIGSILDVFHLLPPTSSVFLEETLVTLSSLEEMMRRTKGSPFRVPVLKYLCKYPKETLEVVCQGLKLADDKIVSLFCELLAQSNDSLVLSLDPWDILISKFIVFKDSFPTRTKPNAVYNAQDPSTQQLEVDGPIQVDKDSKQECIDPKHVANFGEIIASMFFVLARLAEEKKVFSFALVNKCAEFLILLMSEKSKLFYDTWKRTLRFGDVFSHSLSDAVLLATECLLSHMIERETGKQIEKHIGAECPEQERSHSKALYWRLLGALIDAAEEGPQLYLYFNFVKDISTIQNLLSDNSYPHLTGESRFFTQIDRSRRLTFASGWIEDKLTAGFDFSGDSEHETLIYLLKNIFSTTIKKSSLALSISRACFNGTLGAVFQELLFSFLSQSLNQEDDNFIFDAAMLILTCQLSGQNKAIFANRIITDGEAHNSTRMLSVNAEQNVCVDGHNNQYPNELFAMLSKMLARVTESSSNNSAHDSRPLILDTLAFLFKSAPWVIKETVKVLISKGPIYSFSRSTGVTDSMFFLASQHGLFWSALLRNLGGIGGVGLSTSAANGASYNIPPHNIICSSACSPIDRITPPKLVTDSLLEQFPEVPSWWWSSTMDALNGLVGSVNHQPQPSQDSKNNSVYELKSAQLLVIECIFRLSFSAPLSSPGTIIETVSMNNGSASVIKGELPLRGVKKPITPIGTRKRARLSSQNISFSTNTAVTVQSNSMNTVIDNRTISIPAANNKTIPGLAIVDGACDVLVRLLLECGATHLSCWKVFPSESYHPLLYFSSIQDYAIGLLNWAFKSGLSLPWQIFEELFVSFSLYHSEQSNNSSNTVTGEQSSLIGSGQPTTVPTNSTEGGGNSSTGGGNSTPLPRAIRTVFMAVHILQLFTYSSTDPSPSMKILTSIPSLFPKFYFSLGNIVGFTVPLGFASSNGANLPPPQVGSYSYLLAAAVSLKISTMLIQLLSSPSTVEHMITQLSTSSGCTTIFGIGSSSSFMNNTIPASLSASSLPQLIPMLLLLNLFIDTKKKFYSSFGWMMPFSVIIGILSDLVRDSLNPLNGNTLISTIPNDQAMAESLLVNDPKEQYKQTYCSHPHLSHSQTIDSHLEYLRIWGNGTGYCPPPISVIRGICILTSLSIIDHYIRMEEYNDNSCGSHPDTYFQVLRQMTAVSDEFMGNVDVDGSDGTASNHHQQPYPQPTRPLAEDKQALLGTISLLCSHPLLFPLSVVEELILQITSWISFHPSHNDGGIFLLKEKMDLIFMAVGLYAKIRDVFSGIGTFIGQEGQTCACIDDTFHGVSSPCDEEYVFIDKETKDWWIGSSKRENNLNREEILPSTRFLYAALGKANNGPGCFEVLRSGMHLLRSAMVALMKIVYDPPLSQKVPLSSSQHSINQQLPSVSNSMEQFPFSSNSEITYQLQKDFLCLLVDCRGDRFLYDQLLQIILGPIHDSVRLDDNQTFSQLFISFRFVLGVQDWEPLSNFFWIHEALALFITPMLNTKFHNPALLNNLSINAIDAFPSLDDEMAYLARVDSTWAHTCWVLWFPLALDAICLWLRETDPLEALERIGADLMFNLSRTYHLIPGNGLSNLTATTMPPGMNKGIVPGSNNNSNNFFITPSKIAPTPSPMISSAECSSIGIGGPPRSCISSYSTTNRMTGYSKLSPAWTILESLARLILWKPALFAKLKLNASLLRYLAKNFGWFSPLIIAEGGGCDNGFVIAEIGQGMGERDVAFGAWRTQAIFPQTILAMSLEQAGYLEGAQVILESAQGAARAGRLACTPLIEEGARGYPSGIANTMRFSLESNASSNSCDLGSTIAPGGPYGPMQDELALWQERWIAAARRLQQWDVLVELAKVDNDIDLSLDASWRLLDWSTPKDQAAVRSALELVSDAPTPKRLLYDALLTLHSILTTTNGQVPLSFNPGIMASQQSLPQQHNSTLLNNTSHRRISELGRTIEEGFQICLAQWAALPKQFYFSSDAHHRLLLSFQLLVEVQEALPLFVAAAPGALPFPPSMVPELRGILGTWRERLPSSEYDSLEAWSDLAAWRQSVFGAINGLFSASCADGSGGPDSSGSCPPSTVSSGTGFSTATSGNPVGGASSTPASTTSNNNSTSLLYRGYHESAWLINRFATVARKQGLPDICVQLLNKIYSLPNIEIQDAFWKLSEQAQCYLEAFGDSLSAPWLCASIPLHVAGNITIPTPSGGGSSVLSNFHAHSSSMTNGNPVGITHSSSGPLLLVAGLEIINSTNLAYFSTTQKAEFFLLKGKFLEALGITGEEANKVHSQAVQLDINHGRAWAAWGDYNRHRFYDELIVEQNQRQSIVGQLSSYPTTNLVVANPSISGGDQIAASDITIPPGSNSASGPVSGVPSVTSGHGMTASLGPGVISGPHTFAMHAVHCYLQALMLGGGGSRYSSQQLQSATSSNISGSHGITKKTGTEPGDEYHQFFNSLQDSTYSQRRYHGTLLVSKILGLIGCHSTLPKALDPYLGELPLIPWLPFMEELLGALRSEEPKVADASDVSSSTLSSGRHSPSNTTEVTVPTAERFRSLLRRIGRFFPHLLFYPLSAIFENTTTISSEPLVMTLKNMHPLIIETMATFLTEIQTVLLPDPYPNVPTINTSSLLDTNSAHEQPCAYYTRYTGAVYSSLERRSRWLAAFPSMRMEDLELPGQRLNMVAAASLMTTNIESGGCFTFPSSTTTNPHPGMMISTDLGPQGNHHPSLGLIGKRKPTPGITASTNVPSQLTDSQAAALSFNSGSNFIFSSLKIDSFGAIISDGSLLVYLTDGTSRSLSLREEKFHDSGTDFGIGKNINVTADAGDSHKNEDEHSHRDIENVSERNCSPICQLDRNEVLSASDSARLLWILSGPASNGRLVRQRASALLGWDPVLLPLAASEPIVIQKNSSLSTQIPPDILKATVVTSDYTNSTGISSNSTNVVNISRIMRLVVSSSSNMSSGFSMLEIAHHRGFCPCGTFDSRSYGLDEKTSEADITNSLISFLSERLASAQDYWLFRKSLALQWSSLALGWSIMGSKSQRDLGTIHLGSLEIGRLAWSGGAFFENISPESCFNDDEHHLLKTPLLFRMGPALQRFFGPVTVDGIFIPSLHALSSALSRKADDISELFDLLSNGVSTPGDAASNMPLTATAVAPNPMLSAHARGALARIVHLGCEREKAIIAKEVSSLVSGIIIGGDSHTQQQSLSEECQTNTEEITNFNREKLPFSLYSPIIELVSVASKAPMAGLNPSWHPWF